MTKDPHFVALQNMYLAAPINELYRPSIEVADAEATIEMSVSERFFHSAGAVHGSVYFKLLDDAAFFAANSLVRDVFVLTTSFTIYLLRPLGAGRLRSVGRVVSRGGSQYVAEAVLCDADGRQAGRGSGVFVRSKIPLAQAGGYAS